LIIAARQSADSASGHLHEFFLASGSKIRFDLSNVDVQRLKRTEAPVVISTAAVCVAARTMEPWNHPEKFSVKEPAMIVFRRLAPAGLITGFAA
jgi:hypothetical protein